MTSENRARNAISELRKGSYEDWVAAIQKHINEHAKQCLQQAVERINDKILQANEAPPFKPLGGHISGLESSAESIRQLLKELE